MKPLAWEKKKADLSDRNLIETSGEAASANSLIESRIPQTFENSSPEDPSTLNHNSDSGRLLYRIIDDNIFNKQNGKSMKLKLHVNRPATPNSHPTPIDYGYRVQDMLWWVPSQIGVE